MAHPRNKDVTFLFVNPPLDLSPDFVDYPYFANLGIYHNAAVLRQAGHDVHIADSFALKHSAPRRSHDRILLGSPVEALQHHAREVGGEHNWVVIQNSPFLQAQDGNPTLAQLLHSLRNLFPTARIVLADLYFGGMHYVEYDSARVRSLYPEIDLVLKHEAEAKWSLLTTHESPPADTLEQPIPTDLTTLPLPAWDLVDARQYSAFLIRLFKELDLKPGFSIHERAIPIVTTRGCAYRCVFCSSHPGALTRNSYRAYPLPHVADLLEDLQEQVGVEKIIVLDGMVNVEARRFSALLELLNSRDLHYEFPNGMRADRLTREQIAAMKGRITSLSISAESGSQEVLENIIGKKQDLNSIERTADWCRELSMPLTIHYLLGLPGETVRDMNATLSHALRMKQEYGAKPAVQYAVPLPGTRLAAIAQERGLIAVDRARDYFAHFSRTPALSTGPCPRETVQHMKELFDARLASSPGKIIINLTYRCNNHCMFCAVGDREPKDGDLETHRKVLETARRGAITLLDFDGGEPTLYSHLLELIHEARKLGFEKINVTTNGRRLSYEHFARALLDSGITGLLVSLHGPSAKGHEQLTRAPGSFEQTMAGIRNILRLKPKEIDFGINTTLSHDNIPLTETFLEFVSVLGVRRVTLQLVTPFGRATGSMIPNAEEVRKFVAPALDRYGSRLDLTLINTPPCYLPGHERYTLADFAKQEREMVFVGPDRVNLFDYLSERRRHKKECAECAYFVACPGFWEGSTELGEFPSPLAGEGKGRGSPRP